MDIDINTEEAYKRDMTYTKQNLPNQLLKPPIAPPNDLAAETWARNWSIYAISRQWGGGDKGQLTAIATWLHMLEPGRPKLSRQRILSIRNAVSWATEGYADAELGLEPPQSLPAA